MPTHLMILRPLALLSIVPLVACGDDVSSPQAESSSSGDTDTSPTTVGPTTSVPTTTTAADTTDGTTSGSTSLDATGDESESSGTTGDPEPAATIPSTIKELVALEHDGTDVPGFPLEYVPGSGSLQVIPQLEAVVMAAFLDPLTTDAARTAPTWGSNNDFIAYLGDGWQAEGAPYFAGSGDAGWMWTNFEYISNDRAAVGAAPTGIGLQLVTWLHDRGVEAFQFDVTDSAQWDAAAVDAYILWHKRMVGGALYRAERGTNGWEIVRSGPNVRFDATSDTRLRITGPIDVGVAQDDDGADLPPNVVPGTSSNCSGGITPWGTILSGEENTQTAYGNVESCWSSSNAFVSGGPCDPGSAITWSTSPSASSDFNRGTATNTRPHYYGYIVEIDPESDPSVPYDPATGDGHQKLGALGRAHWENATFHVGPDFQPVPGQPIVLYAADDTRGGRIYKYVSSDDYAPGMSKAELRNLLTDGSVYAAHFADLDNSDDDAGALGGVTVGGMLASAAAPGHGQWIRMSTGNQTQVAPNAGGGAGGATTVGDALQSTTWNGIGGFPDDATMLMGLYTACNKIGVRELDRPEDVEWNAATGTLWIAFTNHDRANALRDDGTLNLDDPLTPGNEHDDSRRSDTTGSIFVLREADPDDPSSSLEFTFHTAWRGTLGTGTFDAKNPDNIVIDRDGGVWFGTDGNYSTDTQDAIYYLEQAGDPAQSQAWRIASVPSDAEATGPMMAADELTLFFNVQHPHEEYASAPDSDFAALGTLGPRSGQVALTLAPR